MKNQDQIKRRNYYLKHRAERIAYATKWNKEHKEQRKEIAKRDNAKRKILKRLWHERKWFGREGILDEQSGRKCHPVFHNRWNIKEVVSSV